MSPVDAGANALWKWYRRRPGEVQSSAVGPLLTPRSGHPDYSCTSRLLPEWLPVRLWCSAFESPLKCWWGCFRDTVWSWWPDLGWFPSPFVWGTSWTCACGIFPSRLAQLWRNWNVIFQIPLHLFGHKNLETLCSWVIWAAQFLPAPWRPDAPMRPP